MDAIKAKLKELFAKYKVYVYCAVGGIIIGTLLAKCA